jgi:hypothetical protein
LVIKVQASPPFLHSSLPNISFLPASPALVISFGSCLSSTPYLSIMSSPLPPSNGPQVIPVPPGMTVEQFESLQGHLGQLLSHRLSCIPTDDASFQSLSVRQLRI